MKLTEDQITQVIAEQQEFLETFPMWRKGQSLFNALCVLYPDIADEIRGTSLDPFHRDDKIQECIDWLKKE